MPIPQNDGSIILTTKIDTKGIKSGFAAIRHDIDSTSLGLKKIGALIVSVFSVRAIFNFAKASGELATQTEANTQRLIDIYGKASKSIEDFIDKNARALGMSKSAAASFSSVYGNLFSVWADQKTNAELTARYLNMTSVIASKTGRTVADVQERVRSGLLGNTEAIEDLGVFVNVKTIEMTDAFQRMANGKSWQQLTAYEQQQIRTLAILEQATAKYGDEVAKTTALTRAKFNASFEDFKATFGTFVNTFLMPLLETLTRVFDVLTIGMKMITGTTKETTRNIASQSDSISKSVENQNKLTEAVEETSKAQKKLLASFDEAEILTGENAESTPVGGAGSVVKVDFGDSKIGEIASDDFDPMRVANEIRDAVDILLPVIASALVAIGLIMISSGSIGWGLGFIIGGAALYSVHEVSGGEYDITSVKKSLDIVLDYIDEALIAIGLILLFLGQVPLGLGMILVGATIKGIQELNQSEYNIAELKTKLAVVSETVSVYLAAIGVLLMMLGHIPLGLGFIITGAVLFKTSNAVLDEQAVNTKLKTFLKNNKDIIVSISLGILLIGLLLLFAPVSWGLAFGLIAAGAAGLATTANVNEESINKMISDFFQENEKLITGLSLGLIVLGIILCFAGLFPLAFGLIAFGAVGLAETAETNNKDVSTMINNFIEENSKLIIGVSAALLVLGILLLFVPGMFGLGMGLIIAGSGALGVTASLFDWGYVLESIQGVWEDIKEFWNTNIAEYFTSDWWGGLAKDIGNGLIGGFEGAVNAIITLFENMINGIVEGINNISFDIPDWLGGGHFGFDLGSVSLGRLSIPRLAQGTVVPPNKEFMSILGDNTREHEIVSPVSLMKQAYKEAAEEMGLNGQNTKEEHYYLNETELMRIIYKLFKGGERLNGDSLVNGGVF